MFYICGMFGFSAVLWEAQQRQVSSVWLQLFHFLDHFLNCREEQLEQNQYLYPRQSMEVMIWT